MIFGNKNKNIKNETTLKLLSGYNATYSNISDNIEDNITDNVAIIPIGANTINSNRQHKR